MSSVYLGFVERSLGIILLFLGLTAVCFAAEKKVAPVLNNKCCVEGYYDDNNIITAGGGACVDTGGCVSLESDPCRAGLYRQVYVQAECADAQDSNCSIATTFMDLNDLTFQCNGSGTSCACKLLISVQRQGQVSICSTNSDGCS